MTAIPSVLAASSLLLGLLTASCAPAHDRSPDFLLVTLDTLRSDFISSYGYPRKSTPRLDRLASEGALFENHFTTITTTAPAHATLFSGLFAREHGLTKNGQKLSPELPNLPELLRTHGYRTGASIGARILGSEHGFARGFDAFDEDFGDDVLRPPGRSGSYERYAESVIDRAIGIAAELDERPLFLWVHIYDAHEPYSPPRRSPLHPERSLEFFRRRAEESAAHDRDLLSRMLAGYEAEVFYIDQQLGRLLDAWDARASSSDSLVVVTSDHGEGLGEHSYQGHGFLLYEEQVHIPLIMRMPGRVQAGLRVNESNSSVDLGATILSLLDLGTELDFPGQSLMPSNGHGAENRDAFAERRVYEGSDLRRSSALRELVSSNTKRPIGSIGEKCMLVREGWKFIWNANGKHELYQLAADPREKHNLIAEHPDRSEELLSALQEWRTKSKIGSSDPVEDEIDSETREMLEALGY